jgi:hypothetical protein
LVVINVFEGVVDLPTGVYTEGFVTPLFPPVLPALRPSGFAAVVALTESADVQSMTALP